MIVQVPVSSLQAGTMFVIGGHYGRRVVADVWTYPAGSKLAGMVQVIDTRGGYVVVPAGSLVPVEVRYQPGPEPEPLSTRTVRNRPAAVR